MKIMKDNFEDKWFYQDSTGKFIHKNGHTEEIRADSNLNDFYFNTETEIQLLLERKLTLIISLQTVKQI